MTNPVDRQMFRWMAWERAKGELRSILVSFSGNFDKYRKCEECIESFIKEMEDHEHFA